MALSKLFVRSAEAAAPSFGVNIIETSIRRIADLEPAITNLVHQSNGGLVFPTDSFTTGHAELIVELAARYRLPAIYARPEFMMAGGLMRYSIDYIEQYQQAAAYIDRLLKGAKPGGLPVQQPTKYIFAINLKTARTLGLEMPPVARRS